MTAEDFWNWFILNNNKFSFLNQVEDISVRNQLLDDFLFNLHLFCDNLFFLIGGYPDDIQELIITADGNKKYFPKVVELTKNAPNLDNWKIIAFKPPQPLDFITKHNQIKLNPKKMWFLPLTNNKNNSLIGLKIYWDEFNQNTKTDNLFAAKKVVENILGEKNFAEDIAHIDIGSLPSEPEEKGLIELFELMDYIIWFKARKT